MDWHNRFIRHLSIFLGINLFLLAADILNSGLVTWSRWPILVWGMALILQWMQAPRPRDRNDAGMLNGVLTTQQK